ncbi:leucine-rich repeat domain-containing protein [Negadavirga shengliensis]|uniref:Leucine-rich repeat domain-containing protein n=1 Tax=Negadavirga shengliensis TaxID=1389218 RepID=A0ABV9T2D0_9BACT
MTKIKLFISLFVFFLAQFTVWAQDLGGYSKQEIKDFSQQVEDQVRFLQYFLNTVGSGETSARDKDVIIRESYKKIFRDDKVQVEDDLLSDRKVITNKNVTSYLKDVEFFFRDASFQFKIREIKPQLRDNGELFFEVSIDRTLTAMGLNSEKIENTQPRFIEINLEKASNELKIASIYTTRLSRDKELQEWWETLSLEWENYFRRKFQIEEDSIEVDLLYKISSLDSLDLSGNQLIIDLSPIQALRELKYVDISGTQINELNPISNVTFLTYLDISDTPNEDIQFIKYSERLTHLNISGTRISNIDDLANLKNLKELYARGTPLMGFGVLNNFTQLEVLDLEENGFNNIENIKALKNLKVLNLKGNFLINFGFLSELEALEEINLEETNILDLSPLAELPKLWRLNINGTEVSQLEPLNGSGSIRRIYADKTSITENAADEFARRNRRTLLIHNVENLQTWWETLPEGWNQVFIKVYPNLGKGQPSVEELSELVSLDTLNLSSSQVVSLRPALKFKKTVYVTFENTKIQDLSPLAEMKTLVGIKGDNSEVTNLEALRGLSSLKEVSFRGTKLKSVDPLKPLTSLKYINVDHTDVPKWEVEELVSYIEDAVVVYRTDELNSWWDNLDDIWKGLLSNQFDLSKSPDTYELHRLTASPRLKVESADVFDLEALLVFFNLRELEIHNVPLADPSALSRLESLQHLKITEAPFRDLSPLSPLTYLESLNVSNTAIEDLRPLGELGRLKRLNLSGTNISRLRGLETLYDLRELDIASTNVRNLKPIMHLVNLDRLVCFNTRINTRQVDTFKRNNPDADVRHY